MLLPIFLAVLSKAQWVWKTDSLKRSDVIQFSGGVYLGAINANTKYNELKSDIKRGWEQGFKFQLQAKLSPAISILLDYKLAEQTTVFTYQHPDFFDSYLLYCIKQSIAPTFAYTLNTEKHKKLITLFAGISFNSMQCQVKPPMLMMYSSPYGSSTVGSDALNTTLKNTSYVFGLSKDISVWNNISIQPFVELEYQPEYIKLRYFYYDKVSANGASKTTQFTFSSTQTRLGLAVKW